MALFSNMNCQICDRFITEEQWNNHLFSSRHLKNRTEWILARVIFTKNKTSDEGGILEKAFWEMICGSEDLLPVYGFLKSSIMMVTKMKD